MSTGEAVTAVVLDHGSSSIKAGFAGEDSPRTIFPTVIGRPKEGARSSSLNPYSCYVGDEAMSRQGWVTLSTPGECGLVTDWDCLEQLITYTYEIELRAHPEEHPCLLTEIPPPDPLSCDFKRNREKMIELMIESYNIPAVHIANKVVLSLLQSGRTTGVVLEVGHEATYSVPIFDGYALSHAIARMDIGGKHLTSHFAALMTERGFNFSSSVEMEISRDMKEKTCYVADDYPKALETSDTDQNLEFIYEIPDGNMIVAGTQRFRCPEVLFRPSLIGKSTPGVTDLLLQSISRCDFDLRRDLFSSIVLTGRSTLFPGFVSRFQREAAEKSPPEAFVAVVAPPERMFATWLGGSLVACSSAFHPHWVTRRDFQEFGPGVVHLKCF